MGRGSLAVLQKVDWKARLEARPMRMLIYCCRGDIIVWTVLLGFRDSNKHKYVYRTYYVPGNVKVLFIYFIYFLSRLEARLELTTLR